MNFVSSSRSSLVLLIAGALSGCFLSHEAAEATCTERPSCAVDWTEVPSCEGEERGCYEDTLCGVDIACRSDFPCDAVPSCEEDEFEVESCEGRRPSTRCTVRALCDTAIYCEALPCRAIPTCEVRELEIPTCGDGSPRCREVSVCNTTIICYRTSMCTPACRPGETEVEECPFASTCEQRFECGDYISCMEVVDCEAEPVCPEGSEEISLDALCDADGICFYLSECGSTIQCRTPLVVAG